MPVSREHSTHYSIVYVLQPGPAQTTASGRLHYERISFHGFQRRVFIWCCQSAVPVSVIIRGIGLEVLGLDRWSPRPVLAADPERTWWCKYHLTTLDRFWLLNTRFARTLASSWLSLGRSRYWFTVWSLHLVLIFCQRQPKPSVPTAEAFVRECRTCTVDFDIMGMRGTYHITRVLELVVKFEEWRKERVPGSRAFQSTYDRCILIFLCFCPTALTWTA